jgi:hypothetical protein
MPREDPPFLVFRRGVAEVAMTSYGALLARALLLW